LAINEKNADIVKLCFDLFLEENGLAKVAKRLNEEGKRINDKEFSVSNLDYLLNNRVYLGVRSYMDRGEKKEAKACWDQLIDIDVFEKVQSLLKKSRFKRKSPTKSRYPYLLTGLCFCAYCGDRLVGKSAHGNSGKVGYYAHGNKEKRVHCSRDEEFTCQGRRRYPAKRLEPAVLERVEKLILSPVFVRKLWDKSKNLAETSPLEKEHEKLSKQLKKVLKEEENLALRISKLPEDVPADALYKRLKEISRDKTALMIKLDEIKSKGVDEDLTEFSDFNGAPRSNYFFRLAKASSIGFLFSSDSLSP